MGFKSGRENFVSASSILVEKFLSSSSLLSLLPLLSLLLSKGDAQWAEAGWNWFGKIGKNGKTNVKRRGIFFVVIVRTVRVVLVDVIAGVVVVRGRMKEEGWTWWEARRVIENMNSDEG